MLSDRDGIQTNGERSDCLTTRDLTSAAMINSTTETAKGEGQTEEIEEEQEQQAE